MSNRDLIFNRGYSIVATFQVSRFTMFLFVLAASLSLDLGLLFAASFGLADRVVEQKLTNGLTILMVERHQTPVVSLNMTFGVGGVNEQVGQTGLAHLYEHMAFKGTTTRSSREIVEEIEAVGGDLNAGTSTETTAYYARVMKADVPLALDVLSDILANPSFVPDELEREKSVIVQEIGAAQDTPDDVVFEHLNELCYPDQPMGRSLLGTAKTLRGFNRALV